MPSRGRRGCLIALAGCATSLVIVMIVAVIALRVTYRRHVVTAISMEPALVKGDLVVVGRAKSIRRGDIITFIMPPGQRGAIQRVVGLPGEVIELEGGFAVVNGIRLDEPYVMLQEGPAPRIPVVRDMSAGRVPDDAYFVLGDNRDHANDSRFIGAVPRESIRGRVVLVISKKNGVQWP